MTSKLTTQETAELIEIAKQGAMKHCLRHAYSADEIETGKVTRREQDADGRPAYYVELFLNNWKYTVLVAFSYGEGYRVWPSRKERID